MTSITPASPDERDLIRSLHEGSVSAFAEIYERTAPVLYSLALRIVGSRERAACVLEDLYEEIWRGPGELARVDRGPDGRSGRRPPALQRGRRTGRDLRRVTAQRCRAPHRAQAGPPANSGSLPPARSR